MKRVAQLTKLVVASLSAFLLLNVGAGFAHVVVKPAEAPVASFESFAVSVPNEKNVSTTMLKLVIPAGLQYVSPTVKPGWQIAEEKTGDGETAVVTSITWSSGAIPEGQRDDFSFSAKTPAQATTLEWRAYQTYSDGTLVSWDQKEDPKNPDSEDITPFSVTKVIPASALPSATSINDEAIRAKQTADRALYIAIIAIILGVVVLAKATAKKQ